MSNFSVTEAKRLVRLLGVCSSTTTVDTNPEVRGVTRMGPKGGGGGAHLKFEHLTRTIPRAKGKKSRIWAFGEDRSRTKGVLEPP